MLKLWRRRQVVNTSSIEYWYFTGRPKRLEKSTAQKSAATESFFVPPYVGPSGWVGVWLDGKADWEELAGLLEDSYRLTAPKRLLKELE